MLYLTMPLNGLLMIAMPIALAIFLQRRLGVRGSLFGAGALTFIASQVLHIPFLWLLTALFAQHVLPSPPSEWTLPFNAVVLGLAAGLFEEVARWIAYRYFLRTTRTWKEALMFGTGHGGIEAILLGMVVLVLQAFTRCNVVYLVAAVLWHAGVDATAVFAVPTWGIAVTEAMLTVWALAGVLLIVALRPRAPAPIQPAPALAT